MIIDLFPFRMFFDQTTPLGTILMFIIEILSAWVFAGFMSLVNTLYFAVTKYLEGFLDDLSAAFARISELAMKNPYEADAALK